MVFENLSLYLIMFAFASIIFHGTTGLYLQDFGDAGTVEVLEEEVTDKEADVQPSDSEDGSAEDSETVEEDAEDEGSEDTEPEEDIVIAS